MRQARTHAKAQAAIARASTSIYALIQSEPIAHADKVGFYMGLTADECDRFGFSHERNTVLIDAPSLDAIRAGNIHGFRVITDGEFSAML